MSEAPPVRIEDLTWRYLNADEPALSEISLTVEEGEVLGFVGPNENGKTTLLKSISGIIPRASDGIKEGTVELFGDSVDDLGEYDLATTVGFVFSDPELQFTMMNVEDEIVFGLENLELDVDEIEERLYWAANKVGIEDLLDKSPLELSGGQKQRVALASVIAMRPDIFVFDEPTNMLDPRGKAQVFEIIEELIEEGKTVVIAEHDLEYLSPLADELLYLKDGEITKRGEPRKFYTELTDEEIDGLFAPEVLRFARGIDSDLEDPPLTEEEAVEFTEQLNATTPKMEGDE
jgi:energy-coupling factor transporter ATP-binding protein EcfA2